MTRICQVCDSEVRRRGARFCGKCGSKLNRHWSRSRALIAISVIGLLGVFALLEKRATRSDSEAVAAKSPGATVGTLVPSPASSVHPVPPSDLDAQGVTLTEPKELDSDGVNPEVSPNGREVLFSKDGYLWLMDLDGANKTRLTSGDLGVFTPDGRAVIALERSLDADLRFIDRATGNTRPIDIADKLSGVCMLRPGLIWPMEMYWSKDNIGLFLVPYSALTWCSVQTDNLDVRSVQAFREPDDWLLRSTLISALSNVTFVGRYWVGRLIPQTIAAKREDLPDGVWVIAQEGHFARLLLVGYTHPSLAPGGTVVFAGIKGGIYSARLRETLNVPRAKFVVSLGDQELRRILPCTVGGSPSRAIPLADIEVYASVEGAKLNPFTNQVISGNGAFMGIVHLKPRSNTSEDAETNINVDLNAGDVVTEVWARESDGDRSVKCGPRKLDGLVVLRSASP